MDLVNLIFGGLGMIGVALFIGAVFFSPIALYKGIKNKEWKTGKVVLILFVVGLILWIGSIGLWGAIKS